MNTNIEMFNEGLSIVQLEERYEMAAGASSLLPDPCPDEDMPCLSAY